MPELEDDLGLADGEAVLVGDAAAQNEGVVVQAEVIGINEQYFADLDRLFQEAFRRELYAVLSCGLLKDLTEVEEALARVELVGPQDKFAADVLWRMDGHAVGILTGLELGDASHPTRAYRPAFRQLFAVFCAVWCSCCWHSRSSVADIYSYEYSLFGDFNTQAAARVKFPGTFTVTRRGTASPPDSR